MFLKLVARLALIVIINIKKTFIRFLLDLQRALQQTGLEATRASHSRMEQTTHLVASCLSGSSVALSLLPAGSQSPHYRAAGSAGPGARTAPSSHQAVASAVLKHNITKKSSMHTNGGYTKK